MGEVFMQSLRHRPRSEGGFTVIELLVVMLILGILAAIALPTAFPEDHTEVVIAEVCGVSHSHVQLPAKAGGTFTLKAKGRVYPHASYRFTVNTTEGTITSFELPADKGDKILRC